jgi:hypothetical protein
MLIYIQNKSGGKCRDDKAAQTLKQRLSELYFVADGTSAMISGVVMFMVNMRKYKRFRKKAGKNQINR